MIDDHLSLSCDRKVPLQFVVPPSPTKFGFLARGVCLVAPSRFQLASSLWHFQVSPNLTVRGGTAVICCHMPNVICSVSTNTTGITARASMDFPLVCTSGHPGYHSILSYLGQLRVYKVLFLTIQYVDRD